jgi:hypothetical protein
MPPSLFLRFLCLPPTLYRFPPSVYLMYANVFAFLNLSLSSLLPPPLRSEWDPTEERIKPKSFMPFRDLFFCRRMPTCCNIHSFVSGVCSKIYTYTKSIQNPYTKSIQNPCTYKIHIQNPYMYKIQIQNPYTKSMYIQNPYTKSIYKIHIQNPYTKSIYKIHVLSTYTKSIYKIHVHST